MPNGFAQQLGPAEENRVQLNEQQPHRASAEAATQSRLDDRLDASAQRGRMPLAREPIDGGPRIA
jgi:hypothetical protein